MFSILTLTLCYDVGSKGVRGKIHLQVVLGQLSSENIIFALVTILMYYRTIFWKLMGQISVMVSSMNLMKKICESLQFKF
jgi:hypothetical protein